MVSARIQLTPAAAHSPTFARSQLLYPEEWMRIAFGVDLSAYRHPLAVDIPAVFHVLLAQVLAHHKRDHEHDDK